MISKTRWLLLLIISVCVTTTGICQNPVYNPGKLYSVNELQSDFIFVKAKLEKIHPNLYLYTPKPVLDNFLDSLYKTITEPLTDMEFYNIITLLNAKIKDGHTMFLPGDAAMAFMSNTSKYLPFYVKISNGHMYVTMNCSADTALQPGSEILAINQTPSTKILSFLLARQIRDGENETYPSWILENYFKEYYGFSFGHSSAISITIKKTNSQPQTLLVSTLVKDSIKYYHQLKYANCICNNHADKAITLTVPAAQSYAILTIKDFDNERLLNNYKQNFKSTIDSIFKQVQANNVKSMILDLRDNQGGDFENGQELLSYLLPSPFQLLLKGGPVNTMQKNASNFKGKLVVLINGGSFSNTAIICSRLKFYQRAVFVGDESGGNNTIISGDADAFVLPNTKINFSLSTTSYSILKDAATAGHGVIPDYPVAATIKDIIENKDVVKDYAIGLVTSQQ
jgi:hypothetical protein